MPKNEISVHRSTSISSKLPLKCGLSSKKLTEFVYPIFIPQCIIITSSTKFTPPYSTYNWLIPAQQRRSHNSNQPISNQPEQWHNGRTEKKWQENVAKRMDKKRSNANANLRDRKNKKCEMEKEGRMLCITGGRFSIFCLMYHVWVL